MDTVRLCQDLFGFELLSVLVVKRKAKFIDKFEQFIYQELLCCGLIVYVSR